MNCIIYTLVKNLNLFLKNIIFLNIFRIKLNSIKYIAEETQTHCNKFKHRMSTDTDIAENRRIRKQDLREMFSKNIVIKEINFF